jgi:hypothetical protein
MVDKEASISSLDEILFRENTNPIVHINGEGKVILCNKAGENYSRPSLLSKDHSNKWLN